MKKNTLLFLALAICIPVFLISCDGSVSPNNNSSTETMVYAPQFQLTPTSKAIDFSTLDEYFGGDFMNANNATVASMRLPSLIGFSSKPNSEVFSKYSQTILGKTVSIECTKNNEGSYVFEGTTTDDSIYIRTVVKQDNTVDYLEMKKIDVNGDGTLKIIAATIGTVAIDPSKDYQIGLATGYVADNTGTNSYFNGVFSSQYYLSDKVTASVVDMSEGYLYDGIDNFDSHYGSTMNYENAIAFIDDVSSISIHYPGSGLNLTFHLLEKSLYAQNIYFDGENYFLPESAGDSHTSTSDMNVMQEYVSFLTNNKWTLVN